MHLLAISLRWSSRLSRGVEESLHYSFACCFCCSPIACFSRSLLLLVCNKCCGDFGSRVPLLFLVLFYSMFILWYSCPSSVGSPALVLVIQPCLSSPPLAAFHMPLSVFVLHLVFLGAFCYLSAYWSLLHLLFFVDFPSFLLWLHFFLFSINSLWLHYSTTFD